MTLDEMAVINTCDKASTGHDFSRRYEPFLHLMRHLPIEVLEVGVQFGQSAKLWLEYFDNPGARIYGVDIGKEHNLTDPRYHFEIGNQRDTAFWDGWKKRNPMLHFIVDDAEHRADASKAMFESLWPHLCEGGIYAIEDVGTWMDKWFESPLDGSDWMKELFKVVNWYGKSYGGKPLEKPYTLNGFEKTIDSIHFSKHLVILVKK